MKIIVFVLSAFLVMAPLKSEAATDKLPELTSFLRTEISKSARALGNGERTSATTADEYYLRRWFVRLQALIGIDVPWIASFSIVPEVELVWERPYPQGWTDYKP